MTAPRRQQAWTALIIAFLSKNVAIGFTFGAYGLLVPQLEEEFASGRALASAGIGLIALTMGLASPGLGYLLDRWSIRHTMSVGYLVGALGFWLASGADSMALFLFFFGVVVGTAVAATGILPASKLAANWFPDSTGRAIAFANLPVIVALGPPLFGAVIASGGWRDLLGYFALTYLLLIPMTLLVRDRPRTAEGAPGERPQAQAGDGWRGLVGDPRFWVTVLVAGALFSGGIVMVTHIVAHAVERGIGLQRASLLLSLNGACAVIGAFLFGWLADRFTPRKALLLNAGLQALLWPALLLAPGLISMSLAVVVLGLCSGGAHPALSAMVNAVFGAHRFGTVLGQVTLLVIPFNFGVAPLAGYLFDLWGNYLPAFGLQAGLCILAAVSLSVLSGQRPANAPTPAPQSANGGRI